MLIAWLHTALSGKLKWQKNIQSISWLLRERTHPGLQNEPPLDSLDPQSPNPFMASPSPDPIQRLAIKGFRDWGSRLSSGGSFRSPGWGRSRSSLEIDWIFFCHFNFPESAVSGLKLFGVWTVVNYLKCMSLCFISRSSGEFMIDYFSIFKYQ